MLLSNNGFTPRVPTTPFAKRSIKLNNIDTFLGNATEEQRRIDWVLSWNANSVQFYGLGNINWGSTTDTDALRDFIVRCKTSGIKYVGAIRDSASGFQQIFDYNAAYPVANQQFNDFNFENEFWFGQKYTYTIANPVVIGFLYRVTLNGVNYQYTSVFGDTRADVMNAIYALIPTGGVWNKSIIGANTFQIFATSVNTPFTSSTSANVTTGIINLSRNNWLLTMEQLKIDVVAASGTNWQTGSAWHTSAYVQNYYSPTPPDPSRWGAPEAARMIVCIDVYESTNYTAAPDPDRSILSQYYLLANALAANPSVKPKQICQFINSTEPDYEHGYYSANGIAATTALWLSDYAAYGFVAPYTNGALIDIVGLNLFVYNTMFKSFYKGGNTAGVTYSITLDGITYSYLCQVGDTPNVVILAIYALIPASTSKYVKSLFSGNFVTNVIQIRVIDIAVPVTASASAGITYEPEIVM